MIEKLGRCQPTADRFPSVNWLPTSPSGVCGGKPNQSALWTPDQSTRQWVVASAAAGQRGRDLAEGQVGEPGEDVAEDQAEEDRDPAEEAAQADGHQDHDGHRQHGDPGVGRHVGLRRHRGEVEPDQHDHGAGDHRRQHRVDDVRAEEVDDQAHEGQHHTGDEDRPGDVHGPALLGVDRGGTAHERGRRAEVARDLVLHDQQEADRGDAAHHDGEVRAEPHDDREHERRTEHRDHVLGTETDRATPREPLVGRHRRTGRRGLALVDDLPTKSHDCLPAPAPGHAGAPVRVHSARVEATVHQSPAPGWDRHETRCGAGRVTVR